MNLDELPVDVRLGMTNSPVLNMVQKITIKHAKVALSRELDGSSVVVIQHMSSGVHGILLACFDMSGTNLAALSNVAWSC